MSRLSLRLGFALLLSILSVGCTATMRPPEGPFEDPVAVFLVVDARHAGLIMPREQGGYVEYGYGEWDWYAESKDAWYRVFPSLLWPTQGALARRYTAAPDELELRTRWWWLDLQRFQVERRRMLALLERLDRRFAEGAAEPHFNPDYQMDFVPAEDRYWCFFNCSDALADWLTELGCRVSWLPMRTGVALRRPAEP